MMPGMLATPIMRIISTQCLGCVELWDCIELRCTSVPVRVGGPQAERRCSSSAAFPMPWLMSHFMEWGLPGRANCFAQLLHLESKGLYRTLKNGDEVQVQVSERATRVGYVRYAFDPLKASISTCQIPSPLAFSRPRSESRNAHS